MKILIDPNTKMINLGGRPPRVVTALLVLHIGLFLTYAFADGPAWVARVLGASGKTTLAELQIYQPLTALWIHLGTRNLLLNMLTLWLCGSALACWWGERRFLLFYAVTGLAGLVLGVIIGLLAPTHVLAGSGGAAVAQWLALAMIFPRHLVVVYKPLPFRARPAALCLGAFLLINSFTSSAYLELAVQAGGLLGSLPFLFPPSHLLGRLKVKRAKRKFGVIEGGKSKKNDPKYLN